MTEDNTELFVQLLLPSGVMITGKIAQEYYNTVECDEFECGVEITDPVRVDTVQRGEEVATTTRPVFLSTTKQEKVWFIRPAAFNVIGALTKSVPGEDDQELVGADAGAADFFKAYQQNLRNRRARTAATQAGLILPR